MYENGIYANVADAVNQSDMLMARVTGQRSWGRHRSVPVIAEYEPSLTGWMALNYTLLAALMALPLVVLFN